MQLTDSQVIDLIKQKPNFSKVMAGCNYESRLRIMTETLFKDAVQTESAYYEMVQIMRDTLGDKTDRVLAFMNLPFNVLNITNDCLLDVFRVFEARNANFSTPTVRTTSAQERVNKILAQIDVRKFIEIEGKKALKNAPNTFVIVDKDLEGNVYLEVLKNSEILGYKWKDKGHCELEYIIFWHSEKDGNKYVGFYDAFAYRVFLAKDGNYIMTINNPHGLGYCPVTPFFNQKLNSKDDFSRYNSFAMSLNNLLRWTLFDAYMNYGEHYLGFPIIEKPAEQCSNEGCDGGFVETVLEENGQMVKTPCPTCKASKSKIIGPGTVINIAAAQYDDEKDVAGMFRFVAPPTENIKFEQEQQNAREQKIKLSVTGINKVMEKEAVNVEQVKALMEGAKKPLLFIASMLNALHKFLVKTIVKLDTGLECNVHANYGTEWYLLDEATIQKLFTDAKTAGFPESELQEIYNLLIETKYKGNPETIQRLIIENNLNPAPFKTMEECYKMAEQGIMSREDLAIKANITAFIKRFERENGSIVDFGKDGIATGRITFNGKINEIYNTLKTYITNGNDTSQQGERQSDTSPSR